MNDLLASSILAGLFGLIIGSFLNVCISRLPHDFSVVTPGSYCPRCGAPIAWYDNIPLLSFLLLMGRCRHCRAPIAFRYPLVEFSTGLLFFWAWWRTGGGWAGVKWCLFAAILVELIFSDAETRILPDEFTVGGLFAGLALAPVAPPPGVRAAGLEQLLRQPRPPAPARREPPGQPKQPPGGPARDAHHGLTSPQFLRAGALLGVAAGLLALALVLPFSPLALTRDDGNGLRMGAPAGENPRPGGSSTIIIPVSPSATTTATAAVPGSPTATPSPSPGGAPGGIAASPTPTATLAPGTPTAAASPSATPSPGATATATPTASPTPCTPAIGLPPGTGGLTIPAGGQASFQLQNATGCPAGFSLAYGAAWLVGPAGGTVPAFGSVTVALRVDPGALPAEEGDYPTTVTVTGPANSFTVPVTARRGGQPPQILSAAAACTGAARPGANFVAEAADDVAVVRVTVTFAGEGGPVTLDLGHAGGTRWTLGTQVSLQGVGQVTFTAYDGAGRTAARAVAPAGCGT